MSLLTPLYLLGLAAVALPVLFHLIRRQPRGRLVFSTVMFLDPSPARVTRRSRLDHWPLLLLRALALCLLALAFARPFLRELLGTDHTGNDGESVAILVDTSASMRRDGLWAEAVRRVKTVIAEAQPADCVAILAFDRQVRPVISFEEWAAIDASGRGQLVRERLQAISPGWAATHLDEALAIAAEAVQAASAEHENAGAAGAKRIVVVSDLSEGSRMRSLANTEWPQDITVNVERVEPSSRTNAALQLVAAIEDAGVRVRVTNAADSTREQFQLAWEASKPDSPAGEIPVNVYCPAGQSRVVRIAVPPELSLPAGIILSGDDHAFDNIVPLDRPESEPVHILYSTGESADDPAGMRFYLERAFPASRSTVRVSSQPPDAPGPVPVPRDVPLVVLGAPLAEDQFAGLRRYVEQGGTLLIPAATAEACVAWNRIGQGAELQADEADVAGYAILGGIDFGHPLFAPFGEARFADFASLRIWRHRRLQFSAAGPQRHRVLARFDGGSPAIVEQELGRGRILLFAFGWHPADSQLALSTKFVPLLHALVGMAAGADEGPARLVVGDALPLAGRLADAGQEFTVHTPDHRTVQVTAGDAAFRDTVVPGVYRVASDGVRRERRFTVTLPPEESRTAPLPLEQLEAFGVRLATNESRESASVREARERQLRTEELENRQKHWRWLIVAGLGVLMVETGLAGRLARTRTGNTNPDLNSFPTARRPRL